MGHPNEDLVRRGYEAFSSGDMETLGGLMTPDVVHSVPGDNLTSGEHKGQDEVFAMYGQLFELSDGTVQVELVDVTAKGDDKVLANHHTTAKRGGNSLDVDQSIEFTIKVGKITRLDETSADDAAEDAFWV
jgi:ketosteroid isomerase-like protein